jgi:hypothetical protein
MQTNRRERQRRRRGNGLFPRIVKQTISVAALVVLFILTGNNFDALAQTRKADLAEINSYVAEVDRYIKRNPKAKRIFGDVAAYDDNNPRWREFKSGAEAQKKELYDSAYVWTRDGKMIGANFTLSSPSGDWAYFVEYYFRDDGTLAKIHARLNTFYGDVTVIRDQFFNNRGVRISSTRKILDLKTQKPTKAPRDYFDQPVTVYRKVSELPFFKLW